MKTITVSLPEHLAAQIESYIKNGWFLDEAEVVRTALHEFIQSNRSRLSERFMMEDIEWAVSQTKQERTE